METFEQILGDFIGLVQSINFPNGKYQVIMRFGDQIKPIADKTQQVKIIPAQNGLCAYEISKEKGLEPLAAFIKKTIDYNVEAKAKSKLYNQKVKELQDIFLEHTLQELETLRFVIGLQDEAQYADNSVSFEAKLEDAEISVDEVVEEESKKKAKKTKKEEPAPVSDVEKIEKTEVDASKLQNETVIYSSGKTDGMISGKVDVKL